MGQREEIERLVGEAYADLRLQKRGEFERKVSELSLYPRGLVEDIIREKMGKVAPPTAMRLASIHEAVTAFPQTTTPQTDLKYLAGLIDGEGSFSVSIFYDKKAKLWYLAHDFTMGMLATKEWKDIVEYLKTTYGGSTHFHDGERYYVYRIRRTDDYLRFLDDFIPFLRIKRSDAERVRTSLIAYKAMPFDTRGKATREQWKEWLRRHSLS